MKKASKLRTKWSHGELTQKNTNIILIIFLVLIILFFAFYSTRFIEGAKNHKNTSNNKTLQKKDVQEIKPITKDQSQQNKYTELAKKMADINNISNKSQRITATKKLVKNNWSDIVNLYKNDPNIYSLIKGKNSNQGLNVLIKAGLIK